MDVDDERGLNNQFPLDFRNEPQNRQYPYLSKLVYLVRLSY